MRHEDCTPGLIVKHRLSHEYLIVVNTYQAMDTWWVRARDTGLKMYDMSPEELEESDDVARP